MLRIIKNLCKHFLFSIIVVVFLFILWFRYLDSYTDHDDHIKVPDFTALHVTDLDSFVDFYQLRYEIIDSIFDKSQPKGLIVAQDPPVSTNVKNNRRIYLTINSLKARKVNFPDVFDLTLREAVAKLKVNGFKIGELEYRADIATNKVLAFKLNGLSIEVGQELYYGTVIDLVLGKGLSDKKVIVPNLVGLSRQEANIILKSTSLNIGLEFFDISVNDSSQAVIYKQYPESSEDNIINLGSSIDLYFDMNLKDSL